MMPTLSRISWPMKPLLVMAVSMPPDARVTLEKSMSYAFDRAT